MVSFGGIYALEDADLQSNSEDDVLTDDVEEDISSDGSSEDDDVDVEIGVDVIYDDDETDDNQSNVSNDVHEINLNSHKTGNPILMILLIVISVLMPVKILK